MYKISYYYIITISFALMLMDLLWAIAFQSEMPLVSRLLSGVGILIPLYICMSQMGFSRHLALKIVGWVTCLFLLVGATFKLMHWPGANMILLIAGSAIVVLMLVSAILEGRDTALVEYLLIVYVACRVFRIFHWFTELIYWTEIIVVPVIVLAGILAIILHYRRRQENIGNI